jgi:hypothetical protein
VYLQGNNLQRIEDNPSLVAGENGDGEDDKDTEDDTTWKYWQK